MLFVRGVLGLFFQWISTPLLASDINGQLLLDASVHASSAPVSVYEMINGWQQTPHSGDYAYADTRLLTGLMWQDWSIGYEIRRYYYFTFSEDTASFYFNTENDISRSDPYDLDLKVRALEAIGIRFGKRLQLQRLSITPELTLYQVGAFQFADLSGRMQGSSDLPGSALLDYYYDEDKILDDQTKAEFGQGLSLDLTLDYERDGWRLGFRLQDLLNSWHFPVAASFLGCVNQDIAVCSGSDSSQDLSYGAKSFTTQIPLTLQADVVYQPYGVALGYYQHDRYQRVSVQKDWRTAVGELGLSAHSTAQVGVHWRSRWHQLALISDKADWQQARHLQLQLALRYPW